jgi:ABC-2 type transport system permease protein
MTDIAHTTVPAPIPMPALRVARVYMLEAKYEALGRLRTPTGNITTLLIPILFYALFGLVFGASRKSPQAAQELYLTCNALGAMAPGLFGFGATVAVEREQGLINLKRALPIPQNAYMTGKMLTAIVFATLVGICLAFTAAYFGGATLSVPRYAAIIALDGAGALPFCALGMFIGVSANAQAAQAITTLVYMAMMFLSGATYPLAMLPSFFQRVVVVWPLYHLSEVISAIGAGAYRGHIAQHVADLVGVTILFYLLAVRRLRRG